MACGVWHTAAVAQDRLQPAQPPGADENWAPTSPDCATQALGVLQTLQDYPLHIQVSLEPACLTLLGMQVAFEPTCHSHAIQTTTNVPMATFSSKTITLVQSEVPPYCILSILNYNPSEGSWHQHTMGAALPPERLQKHYRIS